MTTPSDLPWKGDSREHLIYASVVAGVGHDCTVYAWGKSHPGVAPDVEKFRLLRKSPRPFVLFVIADACDAIDRGQDVEDVVASARSATDRKSGLGLHNGVVEYVEHAVDTYARVTARRAAVLGTAMRPVERAINQHEHWELRAWSLHRDSDDHAVREIRRLRFNRARGDREDDEVWAAVAAKVAVDGRREDAQLPDDDPERVVVVEVGLADGSEAVLFDGTAAEARAYYQHRAAEKVGTLTSATTFRPGWNCGRCKWLRVCPRLVHSSGLLGLPQEGAWTRSVSATTLDRYARCPAAYHLLDENLPRQVDEGSAQRRGRAVHEWLKAAHKRPGEPSCSVADLPEPRSGEVSPVDVLTRSDYELAWPYLRQHVRHCPLDGPDLDAVLVEEPFYAYDAHADVVVAATPDLWYVSGDGPVWREVKTTDAGLPADSIEVLGRFTAAALDVVLVAAIGEAESGSPVGRVEFEVIASDDSDVYSFDLTREDVVAAARRRVAELAYEWNKDAAFLVNPTRACRWCAVRRWCEYRDGNALEPTLLADLEDGVDDDPDDLPF